MNLGGLAHNLRPVSARSLAAALAVALLVGACGASSAPPATEMTEAVKTVNRVVSADVSLPAVESSLPDAGNKVGYRIPDFTLELVDGEKVSSETLLAEGKPTFLFFFATT
jgi:cytochrome oxidase Cu insertion factor (SCO1/SenC/PrrC family)